MMINSENKERQEMQMFELQSTKEGLESIHNALQAQSTASGQLAKAFKQQAMLYPKTDPLHNNLINLSEQQATLSESTEVILNPINAQKEAFSEFLDSVRLEYLEKKTEYESKQTKLQKSKQETPELQQAVDDSREALQKYTNEVYEPKLTALLKSSETLLNSLASLPTISIINRDKNSNKKEKSNLEEDNSNFDNNLVKALHSFKANEEEGELEFKRGDLIQVLERNEDGWWKGTLNGRQGIFPSNYVTSLNESGKDEAANDEERGKEKEEEEEDKQETGTTKQPQPQQHRAAFSYLPPGGNLQVPILKPTIFNEPSSPTIQKITSSDKCVTCGCEEFCANMFRPGHCNNCFHKHS